MEHLSWNNSTSIKSFVQTYWKHAALLAVLAALTYYYFQKQQSQVPSTKQSQDQNEIQTPDSFSIPNPTYIQGTSEDPADEDETEDEGPDAVTQVHEEMHEGDYTDGEVNVVPPTHKEETQEVPAKRIQDSPIPQNSGPTQEIRAYEETSYYAIP
jgi:hypothetical protein